MISSQFNKPQQLRGDVAINLEASDGIKTEGIQYDRFKKSNTHRIQEFRKVYPNSSYSHRGIWYCL